MPRYNHAGPMGKGPKTGRGLGKCKNLKPDSQEMVSNQENFTFSVCKPHKRSRFRIQSNENQLGGYHRRSGKSQGNV
jgi:hypothetical protein